MTSETRFRHAARQRCWNIRRAARLADNLIAAVDQKTGPMVCKVTRDGAVVVYHGPTAALMLHPRAKSKYNQFLSF